MAKEHGSEEARISSRTGKPVRRCPRWTRTQRAAFLEHLAATCNVRFAAEAVGMSASGLYQLTRRDAAFREQVSEAVQAGYERVEAELLSHTLTGGGSVERGETGPVAVPAFNPELAIKVLAQRGGGTSQGRRFNGGAPVKRASEREIEDALLSKLKGLAKRLALIA
jgi:hypothetical protein